MLEFDHKIHLHCFVGTVIEAREWLNEFPNLYLGITPLATGSSHRSKLLREVIRSIPVERLLLETDSPYFVPSCVSIPGQSEKGTSIQMGKSIKPFSQNLRRCVDKNLVHTSQFISRLSLENVCFRFPSMN